MSPVRFTEAARTELIDAQDWYETEAPGLGRRFRAEIDTVVRRMAGNPRQFPTVFKRVFFYDFARKPLQYLIRSHF